MQWDTGLYRPVVFSSKNDDSLGESIPGSTGNPQRQQHVALVTAQAGTVRGARFLYARTAICPLASLGVEDVQWVNCGNAVDAYGQPVTLRNGLFANVATLVAGSLSGLTVTGEHLTGDGFGALVNLGTGKTLTALNLTNCLFTGGTNWVTGQANPPITTNSVTWLASASGIYQTAGAARHYLANGSPYRDTGTASVSTNTLALLRVRTTCPPVVFSNVTFTVATNLSPQAQRDTVLPDRGYHYAPLDYVFGGCHTTNANLTVTAGTALGWFRTSAGWYHAGQGIHLGDNTEMRFDGTVAAPTWWVRFNTVQEGGVSTWAGGYGPGGITSWAWPNFTQAPRLTARFLRCAALASDSLHIRDDSGWLIAQLRDCEFYSGGVAGYNSLLQFTNCLFYRPSVWVSHGRTGGDLTLRNCTFLGGTFTMYRLLNPDDPPLGRAVVSVRDCAFDRTVVSTADVMANNPAYTDYGWNAYRTNTTQTTPAGANNVLVTNFNWQAGPLGAFYHTTNSPLVNTGSVTDAALAGLYHHTTQTNQTKEANTRVDIGSHSIALAASGTPVDTDSDGLPDYLEDANGNGVTDTGETRLDAWDTDGDGLSDGEEMLILRDTLNPSLGHLDPLNPDTGNTGEPDGDKDSDHDGLNNMRELRYWISNPSNAHTFRSTVNDAQYLTTFDLLTPEDSGIDADEYYTVEQGKLLVHFEFFEIAADAIYDIYFTPVLNDPLWKWRRIYSTAPGQTQVQFRVPETQAGFFLVFSAKDSDGDGLTDGYESWFTYNGKHAEVEDADTDGDGMRDGWEVQYNLDPTDETAPNGASSDPDVDGFSNRTEHDAYQASSPYNASYDPLKNFSTQLPRPVISISASDPAADELGDVGSFQIQRLVGAGGPKPALTVYYAVGGSAMYGADYVLSEQPGEYPRIFSATIPAGADSVAVEVRPVADSLVEGPETVVITITPYAVSPDPQVPDPGAWAYVVDWNHNRATVTVFDEKVLGEGFMVNLARDTTSGYLRIKPVADTSPLPYVNVANSGRGTVARIKVAPAPDPANAATWSSIVGEYFTAPGTGGDPSRTTVDRYGNVWVANRAIADAGGGAITCIGIVIGGTRGTRASTTGIFTPDPSNAPTPGEWLAPPFLYNTCVDRDGDGLIRTSWGRASGGQENKLAWPVGTGSASDATDEAILRYVRTVPTNVRSIAIDAGNNVWVGSVANGWQEHVHGAIGLPITGRRVSFRAGGYGGLVNGHGILWSAGYASSLLRFVPGSGMPPGMIGGGIPDTGGGYGMGIDPKSGDVWLSNYASGGLWRFQDSLCWALWAQVPGGSQGLRGVAVDGRDNVWAAQSNGRVVHHLKTSGAYVGAVDLSIAGIVGSRPYGVCVDANGMVWAACYSAKYAMRINPDLNPADDASHNPPIGRVVEAVYLGTGADPYNYSDMSGFVTLSTTQPAGFWDFVEDSTVADTLWTKVRGHYTTAANSAVAIEVRAANRITDLPSWPFITLPADGTIPPGLNLKGRYLEVRTTLMRDFCVGASCPGPELMRLALQWGPPGAPGLQILSHPQNQITTPGQNNVSFSVTATGALSYQWLKDGETIAGANSSALVLNAVQYGHAGTYAVQVSGSGCTLQSTPARLHVKGNAPAVLAAPGMSPLTPALGDTVILTAVATASSASVPASADGGYQPVYYQWRRGPTPISGKSGQATLVGVNWTADPVTLPNVQCMDAGDYSVAFWNQYGVALSPMRPLTLPGSGTVTITPPTTFVQNEAEDLILTANYCFQGVCGQWYHTPPGGTEAAIAGANSDTYSITRTLTCADLGSYRFAVVDSSFVKREASTAVSTTTPSVAVGSVALTLNPSWTGASTYTCEESTDYGGSFHSYGEAGQTLLMTMDAGSKNWHQYRITATQGSLVAGVTVTLQRSLSSEPILEVLDVQGGTADVAYTAAGPAGVGPWGYEWSKGDSATGKYVLINGAVGNSYTVASVDCGKQGSYKVKASDHCARSASVAAQLNTSAPSSSTMQSITLKLNPSWPGTPTYTCEESTDYGATFHSYGEAGQTLLMTMDAGSKSWYQYRITATQGSSVASVTASLQSSARGFTSLLILDVQYGTVDVTYTAGSTAGVGPWSYEWSKLDPATWNYVPISGAVGNSYTVTSVDCGKQGSYQVKASDGCAQSASVSNSLEKSGCQ